jgi:hypothetical protein
MKYLPSNPKIFSSRKTITLVDKALIIFLLLFTTGVSASDILEKGETKEVEVYKINQPAGYQILNMGYASSVIENSEVWKNTNKIIREVDLVFTAYPKNKSSWITNYDHLLNQRIKALEVLEPSLVGNDKVKWNFILQTGCHSEEDAKKMFHGAVFKFTCVIPPVKKERSITSQVAEEIETIYNEIETTVYGMAEMQDSVVFKTFSRNNWNNMLIVNDWTGSMYPYGAQAVLWHRLNFHKKAVKYFIFFNDGNAKLDRQKRIGNTGGIFFGRADSLEYLLKVMKVVAKRGTGGDIPENNIEAILKGIRLIKGFDQLVMIADNNAGVRDMSLLDRVTVPVKIVLCGSRKNIPIHPHYLEIARKTGGSIHTIEEDIEGLSQLKEGDKLELSGIQYMVKKGKIIPSKTKK